MVVYRISNKDRKKIGINNLFGGMLSDIPGMIVYNDSGVFGGNKIRMRAAFMFEDSLRSLYNDTIKKIGKDDTDMLWYRAGKDISFRYFSKHRNLKGVKMNKNSFIKELSSFSSFFMGMNFFDKMDIDFEEKIFTFYIIPSQIKKEFNHPYLAGIASGFLSYSLNRNIEAIFFQGDENHEYQITADASFDDVYIPNIKTIKDFSGYSTDFFGNKRISSGLHTFSDFLKFKIIDFCEDECIILKNKILLPFEVGTPSIFLRNYKLIGEGGLFQDSLIKSSEKICVDLLKDYKAEREKIRVIRNILSAIGLMEVYFSREGDIVTASFLKKAFVLENPAFIHLFINGLLNHIHGKEVKIIFEGQNKTKYKV